MSFEVLTMGRVGVDVYPLQTGVGLAEVTSFGKYLGGSPTNVAVAAARYGRSAAVITKTGRDPFGDFVRRALDGYGVDARFVGTSDIAPTPVTFCEIFPPDDFPLYFYRLPKAPDLDIQPDELDLAAVREASVFWMTGTGLSEEPSRAATLAALEHRAKSRTTVFDLDWRPMLLVGQLGTIAAQLLIGVFSLVLPAGDGRAYAVLAMTVVFLAFQQGAISPVTWLMLSEIFPLKLRGFGLGIAAFALWITNFCIGLVFPVLVDAVGVSSTFFLFVAVGLVAVAFVKRCVPETRGRTLENLEHELKARYS
ncbi:PfkB family carbohydrate kinase [Streptomyces sp. NPDC090075]|uniref:PfkB family carbohydrate kinase n=1 Tax=unclassified Streptomyces TaxID=2593676 RepID=UPI00382F9A56